MLLRKKFPRKRQNRTFKIPASRYRSALTLSLLEDRVVPAVSGLVFQDFNANGAFDTAVLVPNAGQGTVPAAVDRGIPGVTVTAFDENNLVVASTLTNANGFYTLNVGSGSTANLRVEFTNLPPGFVYGPIGPNAGSAVQFVTAGAINVNLAVVRPEDYSPNNPIIATTQFHIGGITPTDLNPGSPTIVTFPYSAGSQDGDPIRENYQKPSTHELTIPVNQVGTTWGLAYDSNTDRLFASAFMKRTAGFGPGGPGAIYVMGTSGTTASLHANLNTIFPDHPAGDLTRVFTDSNGNPVPFRQGPLPFDYWFRDGLVRFTDNNGVVRELGWDAVGKIGLGGLDVSADGSTLFTVALADRRLYAVPTSGPLNTTTVRRFDLPVPATVTGRTTANPLGDLRPFAVEVHRGMVYVGAVNSAESTQNSNDLWAYVFAFDPVAGQFVDAERRGTTSDPIFAFRLNYSRGKIHHGFDPNPNFPGGFSPEDPAEWRAWSPVHQMVQQQPFALGRSGWPQPMFTGITFDVNGNMTIGLRDRSGDQFGRNVPINPDQPNDFSPFSMTAGDTLLAGINVPGNLDAVQANPGTPFAGWTLESNGRVFGRGTGPVSTGQGPGGGEFYHHDNFPRDPSTIPVGVVDENDEVSVGAVLQVPGFRHVMATAFDPVRLVGAINGGGVRWYDTETGQILKAYELYVTPANVSTATFAKGNGLGDLVAITKAPPVEVGNFVWEDANGNGRQDPGEAGIANVSIQLFAAGPNGIFGDADDLLLATAVTDAAGNYIFSSAAGTSTSSRIYNLPLQPNTDYQLRISRTQSAIGGRAFTVAFADSQPNGQQRDSNASPQGVVEVRTGRAGAADHSFDVGVTAAANLAIGDQVWNDLNNDGRRQSNEPGVDNVLVLLYAADGVTLLQSTTTSGGGRYLFTGLNPGNYIVEIVPPAGFVSSTGQVGSPTGPFEPGAVGNENDADKGTNQPNGRIRSGVIPLFDRGSASNPDSFGGAAGAANLRVDFGLIRPLSIGNLVWSDINNDGIRQLTEPGLPGVQVNLVDPFGTLVLSTITNAEGGYLFTNLTPGQYRVEIVRSTLPSPAFISSTGANSISSGPFEPAAGNTPDNTDHGTTFGTVVRGPLVNLAYGTQPLNETPTPGGLVDNAADADSNLRQDFGFFRTLTVGNLVWLDTNNNGRRDPGERGAAGVTVRLLDSNNGVLASTQTDANGGYLFENLFPATYRVEIVPPPGLVSSTGLNGSETGPFEPAPMTNLDDQDKGTLDKVTGLIRSPLFTLDLAGSPLNPSLDGLGNLTLDFGLVESRIVVPPPPPPPIGQLASVSGFVYRDIATIDGIREPQRGETGIPGVLITLEGTTADGPIVRTTTTATNGFYQFTLLPPGNYTIRQTQPLGFYDGIDTPGSLGGGSPANDVLTVTLNPGDNGIEYNFGELLPGAVFGFVYEDLNQNRRFDSGEPGIPNVTVTIFGTAFFGTPLARPLTAADSLNGLVTTTNAFGRWEFPRLPPGRYTIVETQPAGYLDFFESVQEPRIRPVIVGNDIFETVVVDALETRGPLNFGELRDVNDPTKRNFLGSSGGITAPPSITPPISTDPGFLELNPAFSVTTGTPEQPALLVVAADRGLSPLVRVFDYATGVERFRFYAYEPSYTGGVRVATGDVNGDGVPDIITATGVGGGPRVRVFSGQNGEVLRDFFAYEDTFRGGVFLAAGDVTGNGRAEIITGTEQGGGPRVTVFDAVTNARIQDFFAFDQAQRGGVRVAAGDINGDGFADLVTTAGRGVQTRVRLFDGKTRAVISDFIPYEPNFTGGVYIAAGDLTGDGKAEVITGADIGGGPHVQVFNPLAQQSLYSFFADDPNYRGGIRLATFDADGDGRDEIITGTGINSPARVRIWKSGVFTPLEEFFAFDGSFTGGVYVG